jgi:hypothetical protein
MVCNLALLNCTNDEASEQDVGAMKKSSRVDPLLNKDGCGRYQQDHIKMIRPRSIVGDRAWVNPLGEGVERPSFPSMRSAVIGLGGSCRQRSKDHDSVL